MSFLCHDLMSRARTYLVLVTEAVVACDIALTISDFDGSARVICATSTEDAETAIAAVDAIEIAFVAGGPGTFSNSALHRELVRRRARIVLLGIEAEATGPTPVFDVLPQPFDTDAVIAKLQSGHPKAG